MRIIIFLCVILVILLILFSIFRRVFGKSTPLNIELFISMMFFGGVGFAFGHHFSSGWEIFGSIFGAAIGLRYKDKLFEWLELLYKDITEDQR